MDRPMPTSVIVGPITWTITTSAEDWAQANEKKVTRRNDFAVCWQDRLMITINPEKDPRHLRDTVLHEIMHAIFSTFGRVTAKRMSEEFSVSVLAPMLLDTLRRNPDLAAWLLETG